MSDKKKCPFCEAIALQRFIEEHHSKPAGFGMALSAALVSYAEEIEAKNSQKYACGLTEQDVESGWECPLDNPNETVECCEDCAFAKETD